MNNSNQLLAHPITEEIEYRSSIDSKKLNEIIRSIEESVMRSLLRGTKLSEDFTRYNLALTSSYMALNRSSQMFNYYPTTSDITSSTSFVGVSFASAFGSMNGKRQNKTAGIVTMDWNDNKKLSKIAVYNGVVSPNIQIYVDGVARPSDDPVYNILDGDNSTFWVESASVGQHTMDIYLPPSSNKTFNYLEIIPFPIFGIEIVKIEYYDIHNTLKVIYPTNENSFYNSGGPLIFHLSPKEFNNTIKITFNVLENINAMGFSSIDICNIDYLNNSNTVYLKFEKMPNNDAYGNSITEIVPASISLDYYVDGVLDNNYDSFITEISIVPDISSTQKISLSRKKGYQVIPTNTITLGTEDGQNCLYLKVVMNEVGITTPVFRGAKLNYTYGNII
jgi:hypothetical protein